MTTYELIRFAVFWSGIAQLVLCLASPFIPIVLKWPEQLRVLPRLLRQIFWTYAAYILGTHLVFAVVSVTCAHWLLDGSAMATVMSGFICLWWGARWIIHLIGFDMAEVPDEGWHLLAKKALGLLFVGLTVVYLAAFLFNRGLLT